MAHNISKRKKTTPKTERIVVFNPAEELPSVVRHMTAERMLNIISLAENGNTRDLFALYRDVISSDNQILTEFTKRKAAVLGDTVTVIPYNKSDSDDVVASKLCGDLLGKVQFNTAVDWLLNATLYPVAVVEKIFAPAPSGYTLADVIPVHYQLLDYRVGTLKIFDTDGNGKPLSTSRVPDPARYIVHRGNLMPVPDHWGGPMRSILFWWLLRTMSRQWWADLLERYGVPFLKGKYSDDAGRQVLERAFRLAVRLGAIVISKGTEAEIVQAAAADKSDSHERFIELCNREISKLITGQTLSTQSQPTGELGGGTANLQGQVRDDLRKMDARRLALTLRDQLLCQYSQINCLPGQAPILVFGSDSTGETLATVALIESLAAAGFEPDDDGMSKLAERVGFGLRRKASAAALPFSAVPLNARMSDLIAPSMSADLAAAFRGRYAPVASLISSSSSSSDCVEKVRSWALSAGVTHVTSLLEEALSAYCAGGAKSATR
jgi:phage gp29-like protein